VLFVVIAATALKHQNGVVVRTAPELFVTPVVYILQNCLVERAICGVKRYQHQGQNIVGYVNLVVISTEYERQLPVKLSVLFKSLAIGNSIVCR
jgi:hypothetical protein